MRAKKQLIEIDIPIYYQAMKNWKSFYGSDSAPSFWFYLDLDRDKLVPDKVPYHIAKKLRLLTSEHWYVLLKAYQARQGN